MSSSSRRRRCYRTGFDSLMVMVQIIESMENAGDACALDCPSEWQEGEGDASRFRSERDLVRVRCVVDRALVSMLDIDRASLIPQLRIAETSRKLQVSH